MARSLFRSRKTSCYVIDLRLAMSLGSNKECSIASVTYPVVPYWKSRMEASLSKGASSNSMRKAQVEAIARWSPLLSPSLVNLVCISLGCLAPLWGSISWEGWVLLVSATSLPFSFIFLLWSTGSGQRDWMGGGVGSLVWTAFPSMCPPG